MRVLSVAGGLWILTIMGITSDAGVSIIGLYYIMFGGAALLVAWLVLFSRRRMMGMLRPAKRWLVVPAYIVIAITLSLLTGPRNPLFLARFRVSQSALTSEAERLRQLPEPVRFQSRRIGLFNVQRVDVIDGQVRMITTACGVIDSCGLVYSPTAEPKRWQEDVFKPIGGRWWHLMQGF